MDFLKSAVASIAKGPAFPYSFGDRVDIDQSIWTLHNGTRKEDNLKCSIFSFDVSANAARLALARNALRKLRTMRHPGIIRVLDTVETDQLIYVATERVTPLSWSTRRKSLSEESLKWGLHSVAKTIKFINDEAASVHGNIRVASIFTTESGEWRIGGLDILSSVKEDDAVIFTQGSLVPDIGRYTPPEIAKGGWGTIRSNPTHAVDAYDFGILITEVFNGGFSGSEQIGSTKNIPVAMQAGYKRLTHAVPKARLSVAHFLEQGSRSGGFFDIPLVHLTEGIDNLGLKADTERDAFLDELQEIAESGDFPEDFFKVKVLPELLKSVEFGGGGAKSFALVMRIANKLGEDEYDSQITPVVVRLFANPDRALRVCLLDNLPLMIDHLSQKVVTNSIFPQMVTGFGDAAPIVREQTVKGVLAVASKLNDRTLNGELLRHLAKTANDEQPGIRTNTTICLGKIAKYLSPNTRAKVLSAAFARALRDPFLHARNAALMALAATVDCFSEEDCASKMLPAICPSLIDKEKMIRDQANKTLNIFLDRVRKYGQTLPDTVLPAKTAAESQSNPTTRMSTPQPGNQWVGWAISSFTNKVGVATGEIQPNANGTLPTPLERGVVTPVAALSDSAARPHIAQSQSGSMVPMTSSNLRQSQAAAAVVEEDFGDGWGDMNDNDAAADAWGDAFDTPQAADSTMSGSGPGDGLTPAAYDDGGEPDFEGWLNAQAKAKAQSKRPLPKGLAKKTTTATTVGAAAARPSSTSRTSGSATVATKKTVAAKSPINAAAAAAATTTNKTTTTAPASTKASQKSAAAGPVAKTEGEDDDWGAWG